MMTGYFVRVERDGSFQSLDLSELTDTELRTFFGSVANCAAWAVSLVQLLRKLQEVSEWEASRMGIPIKEA